MSRPDVELFPGAATSASDADAFITDSMHGLAAIVHDLQRGDGPAKLVHLPGRSICHFGRRGKLDPHGLHHTP